MIGLAIPAIDAFIMNNLGKEFFMCGEDGYVSYDFRKSHPDINVIGPILMLSPYNINIKTGITENAPHLKFDVKQLHVGHDSETYRTTIIYRVVVIDLRPPYLRAPNCVPVGLY